MTQQNANELPKWLTEAGLTTLKEGYLLPGETVQGMFERIAGAAAKRLDIPGIYDQFMWALREGYFCLASPVLSNLGSERGLPISCFGQAIGDSIYSIYDTLKEFSVLSKHGGGVSQYWGFVRPSGSPIKHGQNGASSGTIPFAKSYDATVIAVSQGNVRRGANAFYWPADHGDRNQALRIRRPLGSVNHQCLDSNHAFIFTDAMMNGIVANSNAEDRKFWAELIRTRIETGEPYLAFEDAMNRLSPRLARIYKKFNLKNRYSNICTEIILPSDIEHTFVCCISSLPVHKYKEWKDKGVVRLMTFFLDAVLDEFIEKAEKLEGFERAVRFAKKSRAIGIGQLGWHTFLQNESLPFNSPEAAVWNVEIAKHIQEEAEAASRELAVLRGEPEWCQGEGYRNTHLIAIAPTATNSIISGHVSPGIEPWSSNVFAHKTVKGSFVVRNPSLAKVLTELGRNTEDVWKDINGHDGSVQHLDWLSDHLKTVYLTAYEMDMHDLVDAAAARGEYIDQGQSLNFFFSAPRKGDNESDAEFKVKNLEFVKYVNSCHMHAFKKGLKTLYYCRNKPATKADMASRGHERKHVVSSEDEKSLATDATAQANEAKAQALAAQAKAEAEAKAAAEAQAAAEAKAKADAEKAAAEAKAAEPLDIPEGEFGEQDELSECKSCAG